MREFLEEGVNRTAEVVLLGAGSSAASCEKGVVGSCTLRLPAAGVSRGKRGAIAPASLGPPLAAVLQFEELFVAWKRAAPTKGSGRRGSVGNGVVASADSAGGDYHDQDEEESWEEAEAHRRRKADAHRRATDGLSAAPPAQMRQAVQRRGRAMDATTGEPLRISVERNLSPRERWSKEDARRLARRGSAPSYSTPHSAHSATSQRSASSQRSYDEEEEERREQEKIREYRRISGSAAGGGGAGGQRMSLGGPRASIDSSGRRRSVDQEAFVRQRVSRDAKIAEDWSVKMPKRLAALQGSSPNSRKGGVGSPGQLVRLDPFAERDQFSEGGSANDVSVVGVEKSTMRRASISMGRPPLSAGGSGRRASVAGYPGGSGRFSTGGVAGVGPKSGGSNLRARSSMEAMDVMSGRQLSRTDSREAAQANAMFQGRRSSLPGVPLEVGAPPRGQAAAAARRASIAGLPAGMSPAAQNPARASADAWQQPSWMKARRASAPDVAAGAAAAALKRQQERERAAGRKNR